jgi:D-sedoheptulose 7-phosphate isomerase
MIFPMSKIDARAFAHEYFATLAKVLEDISRDDVAAVLQELESAHAHERQVFLAGNGGSAATASHMASDLLWGMPRVGLPAVRAVSLADNVPVLTAIANDTSYENAFAAQLDALGHENDVLVAISASGNSPNVLRAAETAKKRRMRVVAFLGMGGGKLKELADVSVVVPSGDYGPIEDVHMVLDHLALAYLRIARR